MKKLIIILIAFLSINVMAKNCSIKDYGNRVEAQYKAHNCVYTMIAMKNNSEFQLIENCENGNNAMYSIKKEYFTAGIFVYNYKLTEWDKYGVLIIDKSGSSDIKPGEAWHERITKYCK